MKRIGLFACPVLVLAAFAGTGCAGGKSREEQQQAYSDCLTSQQASILGAQVTPSSGPLVEIDSARAADAVRARLKSDARAGLVPQRANILAQKRCEALKPAPEMFGGADSAEAKNAGAAPTSAADPSGGGASQVSTTNNQVAGVDEADFVKNDNKYIFVANESKLRIIDAWPAAQAHEIASVEVPGTATKLFVNGDRAVVYSSVSPVESGAPNSKSNSSYGYGGYYGGSRECTYGFECVPRGDGNHTAITIFDITDKAAPKLVRQIKTSSSLLAARRVGNVVHTVLTEGSDYNSGYVYANANAGMSEEDIEKAFDEAGKSSDARIDALPVEAVVPWTSDSRPGAAPKLRLLQAPQGQGTSFTTVMSIDMASSNDVGMVSVLSNPGFISASANALYMAVGNGNSYGYGYYGYGSSSPVSEQSIIHKFAIGDSPLATSYHGSGAVNGHVLDQFAMDEKDGKLRVATTSGHTPDPDVHSTLTILEEQSGTLATIGQIDQIAKGEDIRSVRFDDDRGYVVTFKKTDPLFVFDLSDPHAPKARGELQIPGFSTYMHMMDATHLLAIGFDAADQGDFAWFTGIQLQIFDVADANNPTLVHKELIGTRGSSSEALTNHLAFNYFAPKNLLALPMTICEGGDDNGGYGSTMSFSGLMVYDVTAQDGFKLHGEVSHPYEKNQSYAGYGYDSGCYNWWADATSDVKRSIIMDDWVYSISEKRIKVNNLSALSTDVVEIPITDGPAASSNP